MTRVRRRLRASTERATFFSGRGYMCRPDTFCCRPEYLNPNNAHMEAGTDWAGWRQDHLIKTAGIQTKVKTQLPILPARLNHLPHKISSKNLAFNQSPIHLICKPHSSLALKRSVCSDYGRHLPKTGERTMHKHVTHSEDSGKGIWGG